MKTEVLTKTDLKALKLKRNQLFDRYEKNPANMELALEIKIMDDQIAEDVRLDQKAKALKTR